MKDEGVRVRLVGSIFHFAWGASNNFHLIGLYEDFLTAVSRVSQSNSKMFEAPPSEMKNGSH